MAITTLYVHVDEIISLKLEKDVNATFLPDKTWNVKDRQFIYGSVGIGQRIQNTCTQSKTGEYGRYLRNDTGARA